MALDKKKMRSIAGNMEDSFRRGYENLTEAELFTEAEYFPEQAEPLAQIGYSYWRSSLRIFWKNKVAMFFLVLIIATLAFTIIQPSLPGQRDPNKIHNDETGMQIRNAAPNDEFIFGTNAIGQDLWSRIWSGARTSLLIGFTVAFVEAFIGVIIGVMWGYLRKLDFFFTELYNIFDNVPQTLVLILISYVLHPSMTTLIFALCLTGWLTTARYIRNLVIIIRDRDYNLASRCLGTPARKIILHNLLPYLVSIITMRMAMAIPYAISSEVFVTYIGLGLPLETPSLGNLIVTGIPMMMNPALRYQLILPIVVLSVITISFYVIGNSFADASDPKNHVM